MDVLVYGNRKQDPDIYDISTPEKEAAAFLMLFTIIRVEWDVYDPLYMSKSEKLNYEKALNGDAGAAKKLLNSRKHNEYESFYISSVIDATSSEV